MNTAPAPTTESTEPQVPLEDVQAFLSAQPAQPAPDAPMPIELEPQASAELGIGEDKATPAEPPAIEVPADPAMAPELPSQRKVVHWSMEAPDLGEIVVTDTEKRLYLKAALNESPLVWDIDIPGIDSTITVRSRTNYETDVVFRTLREDEAAMLIKDPADFGTRLHQYCCAMQVMKIGSIALTPFDVPALGAEMGVVCSGLREHVLKHITPLNAPRWSLVMTAVRIFTIKENICNTNLANRNFWTPADKG